MIEQLGVLLVWLRRRKGYTQLRVAEGLCAASGVTIARHEVSQWERQERIPSGFWLRWLAVVLEVPVVELEAAATRSECSFGRSRIALWQTGSEPYSDSCVGRYESGVNTIEPRY